MNPQTLKKHERQCIAWNDANPIGSEVVVRLDSGEDKPTKTRSEAYVAASGHPVIFLEDVRGYYLLDRVRRAEPHGSDS